MPDAGKMRRREETKHSRGRQRETDCAVMRREEAVQSKWNKEKKRKRKRKTQRQRQREKSDERETHNAGF